MLPDVAISSNSNAANFWTGKYKIVIKHFRLFEGDPENPI